MYDEWSAKFDSCYRCQERSPLWRIWSWYVLLSEHSLSLFCISVASITGGNSTRSSRDICRFRFPLELKTSTIWWFRLTDRFANKWCCRTEYDMKRDYEYEWQLTRSVYAASNVESFWWRFGIHNHVELCWWLFRARRIDNCAHEHDIMPILQDLKLRKEIKGIKVLRNFISCPWACACASGRMSERIYICRWLASVISRL